MPKVTILQQVYKSRKWMDLVYPAIVAQTFKDIQIVAQIVEDDGDESNGGSCENYIRQNFPQIIIEKPGYNIGFTKGHNEMFARYDAEFFQLVNPDFVLEPDFVEKMVREMEANPHVGALTGKLLWYDFVNKQKTKIFDSTGVIMSVNGRARDRGQHETDTGQYDTQKEVIAVCGAGAMYRKNALEEVKMHLIGKGEEGKEIREDNPNLSTRNSPLSTMYEYFDEDFGSYWEDVDLCLRMQNLGWKSGFVPEAVGFHGRTASSAKKDYADVVAYKKHHDALPARIKQLNYKNHIFVSLKNFKSLHWKFFVREFIMLGYITLLETATLKVLPTFFKQLPKMLQKRKWIQKHRKTLAWTSLLVNKRILD